LFVVLGGGRRGGPPLFLYAKITGISFL